MKVVFFVKHDSGSESANHAAARTGAAEKGCGPLWTADQMEAIVHWAGTEPSVDTRRVAIPLAVIVEAKEVDGLVAQWAGVMTSHEIVMIRSLIRAPLAPVRAESAAA